MTQTVNKMQWPDYSEFGLYLLPRNYDSQYGFANENTPGRCLLLLDTKESITETGAKRANLRCLLKDDEKKISLYLVLPQKKRRNKYEYPTQSQLLQQLELSYVARTQVITPTEATKRFRQALGDLRYKVSNLLDFAVPIGTNHEGDTVFSSPYGRFIERIATSDEGTVSVTRIRANSLPLASCLYALDDKGKIVDEALSLCVAAYVDIIKIQPFSLVDAQKFAQMVFQKRPVDVEFDNSVDISQSIIESVINEATPLEMIHWQLFNSMILLRENLDLFQLLSQHDSYQSIFHELLASLNNRHRLNSSNKSVRVYRPSIPAPLAPILASILVLGVDDNHTLYSPSIGNGSLLAGFKPPLIFHVNEPDANNYKLLKHYVESVNNLDSVDDNKPSYFITNKELALIAPTSKYTLSIALLPTGISPITTLLPFFDNHKGRHLTLTTDRLDQSLIVEVLQSRNPKGRSLFVGPTDEVLGEVSQDSVHLLQYLQAYFYDVSVVDLGEQLFNQNSLPTPSRLYVVGSAKSPPRNTSVLNDRINHITPGFKLPVYTSYQELIEFEQAIRLISVSKRRPEVDPTLINEATNQQDTESDSEEQNLIASFYTLTPTTPKNTDDSDEHTRLELPSRLPSTSDTPSKGVKVDLAGTTIEQTYYERPLHNSSSDSADNNLESVVGDVDEPDYNDDQDDFYGEEPVFNEAPEPDEIGGVEPDEDQYDYEEQEEPEDDGEQEEPEDNDNVVDSEALETKSVRSPEQEAMLKELLNIQALSESEDDEDDSSSDDYGMAGDMEPPKAEFDIGVASGDIDDIEDDSLTTSPEDDFDEPTADSDDDEGDAEPKDLADGDADTNAQSDDASTQSEPTADTNDVVDTAKPENVSENVVDIASPVVAAKPKSEIFPVYYGPRYISEPTKYLVEQVSIIDATKPLDPPVYSPIIDDETPEYFSHKSSELKNKAVKQYFDNLPANHTHGCLKGLSIVETHTPAILISNGIDADTLTVLSLADYEDGVVFNEIIKQFGEVNGEYIIHDVFSLSSHSSTLDISNILSDIEQINSWLALDGKDFILTTHALYQLNSSDFVNYYHLAFNYAQADTSATRARYKDSLRNILLHGQARLLEYKSRFWLNNYDRAPDNSISDTMFCTSVPPKEQPQDKEEFELIASAIVELSHSSIYKSDFSQKLRAISHYLVPESIHETVDKLAGRLSSPKSLAFLSFMNLSVYAHALFYTGVHRYFRLNCDEATAKIWLSKLFTYKTYDNRWQLNKTLKAQQALDVDYARYLLQHPLPIYETAISSQQKIRYNSHTTFTEGTSYINSMAQLDLQNAIDAMSEVWAKQTPQFSVSNWVASTADVDITKYHIEVVDMAFISITNILLKRPTYLFEGAFNIHLEQFLVLLSKLAKALGISMVVTAENNKSLKLKKICDVHKLNLGERPLSNKNLKNDCAFILHTQSDLHQAYKAVDGGMPTVHYFRKSIGDYDGLVRSLSIKGQLTPLSRQPKAISTVLMPSISNHDVLKEVYEQYTRFFDAIRQLGSLASNIADELSLSLLGDELDYYANNQAVSWWFANQSVFIYGKPSKKLKQSKGEILEKLDPKGSKLDKVLSDAITNNRWLDTPNVNPCNIEPWLVALRKHLLYSLQSPQVVTQCLDIITNGMQPLLILDDDYDALTHHVLVSQQGNTLPFNELGRLKNELIKTDILLTKKPDNKALLASKEHVQAKLSELLAQRNDEVLALYHQGKVFDKPLIEDALRCFLSEIQEFYIRRADNDTQVLPIGHLKDRLANSVAFSDFNQLLNTLLQMLDDGVFAKLPLSYIDTITFQLHRHSYITTSDTHRAYNLEAVENDNSKMTLKSSSDAMSEQIDMQTLVAKEYYELSKIKHPARQSRLIMLTEATHKTDLNKIKKSIHQLSPLISNIGDISVWLPTPLCQADNLRFNLLKEYLSGSIKTHDSLLSTSAGTSATHYLKSYSHWLLTLSSHYYNDMPYLLSLIAQKPSVSQAHHIKSLFMRLDVEQGLQLHKNEGLGTKLPQSAFTRKSLAYKLHTHSLEAKINSALQDVKLPPQVSSLLLGSNDSIHDIYYQDSYSPIELDAILSAIAECTINFKNELIEMIDTHPQRDSLFSHLSDHEANPEADYFIELEPSHQRAYIYKHLIKDMGFRGIKDKIKADLRNVRMPASFNGLRATILDKLLRTPDDYKSIQDLCMYIQKNTGESNYIEQLQAQTLAKQMVEDRVDVICQLSADNTTILDIPIVNCRPKANLNLSQLAINTPAIKTMFKRYFLANPPNDTAYLGKSEWLLTCGIKLPHYEKVFDLNNLICYVSYIGSDSIEDFAVTETNARHLYATYIDKKALLVASTHSIHQGTLPLSFTKVGESFDLLKVHETVNGHSVFANTSPLTWKQLDTDMSEYGQSEGIAYEQVLIGDGAHYEMCKLNTSLFNHISFNDVSGRLHKALRMTEHAKSRFNNFSSLFEIYQPIHPQVAKPALSSALRDGLNNFELYCHSLVIDSRAVLSVKQVGGKSCILLSFEDGYSLQQAIDVFDDENDGKKTVKKFDIFSLILPPDMGVDELVKKFGLTGFYTEVKDLHPVIIDTFSSVCEQLVNTVVTMSSIDSKTKSSSDKSSGFISGIKSGLAKIF